MAFDFTSLIGPALGGLFGAMGSSDGNKQTQTQTQTLDPRMADAVYGNLVPGATYWYQSNKYGLNPIMLQGLNQQYATLQDPFTAAGYNRMGINGYNLMGAGVAGNPFTGGGLGSQESFQPSGMGGGTGVGSLGLGGSSGPFSMPTSSSAPAVSRGVNTYVPMSAPAASTGYGNRGDGTGYQGPLTDRDFAAQKEMRDFAGGWSPYDKANFLSALPMLGGFLTGNPAAIVGGMANVISNAPNAQSYTDNYNSMKDMQAAQQADEAALRQIVASQPAPAPAPEAAPTYSWDKDSKSWVVGSSGGGGGGGHDYSGIGGDNVGGGVAANPMGRDPSQAQGGFAKGGMVHKKDLHGPDPEGPDEGKANLQSGEYVIKKSAVKKYGKGLLNAINEGRA